MTDFHPNLNKAGNCSNFGNCSLADSHTTIQVPAGRDFICTECGKSLLVLGGVSGVGGQPKKQLFAVVGLVSVLLAAVAGAWLLLGGMEEPVAPPASTVAPEPAPVLAAPTPLVPAATGNCSDADARSGLCQKR